jgi:hypothetical protein
MKGYIGSHDKRYFTGDRRKPNSIHQGFVIGSVDWISVTVEPSALDEEE